MPANLYSSVINWELVFAFVSKDRRLKFQKWYQLIQEKYTDIQQYDTSLWKIQS